MIKKHRLVFFISPYFINETDTNTIAEWSLQGL